jgi:hypothetical protein
MLLPAITMLVLAFGGPAYAYDCKPVSLFSKQCVCLGQADCAAMRKDGICGASMLCNAQASRCSCKVGRFLQLSPAAPTNNPATQR